GRPFLTFIISSHSTPPTCTSTLSLHDALPILHMIYTRLARAPQRLWIFSIIWQSGRNLTLSGLFQVTALVTICRRFLTFGDFVLDRKSTRLNSSHVSISYAVFCLKKKK